MLPTDRFPPDPPPGALFSREALRRAWRSVRRSGPSPGSDGVTPGRFERDLDAELDRLRRDLLDGSYRPQPVIRFGIPKPSGKLRPVTVWALRDRVAQRAVHDYLAPQLDPLFLECSFGFRPGRSIEDAVRAVAEARDSNRRWVLDADITDCFGSIPPGLLMTQVRAAVPSVIVVKLVQTWLDTPVFKRPRERAGVSQGGVISPLLANLYLHRFDQMALAALPETRLVRFADDFVILCRRRQEALWALSVARRSLANLRLALNADKTRVVHFDDGFTFLGVTFKGRAHTLLPNERRESEGKE